MVALYFFKAVPTNISRMKRNYILVFVYLLVTLIITVMIISITFAEDIRVF